MVLSSNKVKMEVVDHDLFKDLNHRTLAKHVFPDEYFGKGHNTHTGRMVCVNQIVDVFKKNMKLNLQIAFRKWASTEFVTLGEPRNSEEGIAVVRENISRKNCCTLYCKDCKAMGYCCPVAKVSFFGDLDSDVEGGTERNCSAKVSCLYFHNSHTWHHNAELMLAAGFCGLEMSREFIAGDTYEEAIKQGRKLLHEEKGSKANSKLGKKEPGNSAFAFTYLQGQTENNLAQMMASNCHPEDWSKRLPRLTWGELVDPATHMSNMVRLYYCASVQLGISRMASPFEIHYDDKWLMAGSVPNPEHNSFMQEEAVLVGGFVYGGPNVCQPRHSYHSLSEVFLPNFANIRGLSDGSSVFSHGFTVMMSLVEGEERSLYLGHPNSKMEVYKDRVLVMLANVPRGGLTVSVDRNSQHIWPALHVHMDTKRKPREPNTVVEVPVGYCYHDLDLRGGAAILTESDESTRNGAPAGESVASPGTTRESASSVTTGESAATMITRKSPPSAPKRQSASSANKRKSASNEPAPPRRSKRNHNEI